MKWKSVGFAAVEFLPVVLPRLLLLLLLSSPSLTPPCAAWVILFQQHPCLPGRGMKPSDTIKTQTKTLDMPCAGPWARSHQTLSLSFLYSPCVSFSLFYSHIHTWTQSRQSANSLLITTDTLVAVSIITLALSPEYSEYTHGQIFRGVIWELVYSITPPVCPTHLLTHIQGANADFQTALSKKKKKKSQGRSDMRGKLMDYYWTVSVLQMPRRKY